MQVSVNVKSRYRHTHTPTTDKPDCYTTDITNFKPPGEFFDPAKEPESPHSLPPLPHVM